MCMFAIFATAQVADYRGVKVTQVGNMYSATCSKKSANGGNFSEKWTGNLVNGKRSGVWTFTGTYNQYIMEGGRCMNGSVSMTRTYKEGIPSGPYSVTYNITDRNATFNIITNSWIYGEKHNMTEKVSGAFIDGKPNGKWTISSQRKNETWAVNFVNGYADGQWKSNINNETQEFMFKNGYGVHQKVPQDDGSWGYELKYDKDPSTIFPQDTIEVGKSIMYYFSDYALGMFIITDWVYDYPKNSSNEKTPGYYILSDFKKYYQPYGNIPERIISQIKYSNEMKILEAIDKFAADTLLIEYQNFCDSYKESPLHMFYHKLNSAYVPKTRNRFKEIRPSEWYERTYLRDSLVNGKYNDKIEQYSKWLNANNKFSRHLNNITSLCYGLESICPTYDRIMEMMKNDLSIMGYENIYDEDIWRLYKSPEYEQMKKDYFHKQDSIATREALVISYNDIHYFVITKCFKYIIENDKVVSATQIIEDVSSITNDEVIDFIVQHADKQNRRYYSDDYYTRKANMYTENSPGNIVAKKKNKLIKQLKKRFDL